MSDPKHNAGKLVHFFVSLTLIGLGLRVVFSLFNADLTNSFVVWLYDTTDVLLQPFRGLFPEPEVAHQHILEMNTLFAMASYAVVGYLVLSLLSWVPKPRMSSSGLRKWAKDRL